jgi:hypothetical protein
LKARILGWGLLALFLAFLAPKDDSDSDSDNSDSGGSDSGASDSAGSAAGSSDVSDSDSSDSGGDRPTTAQDAGASTTDPVSQRRSGRPAYPPGGGPPGRGVPDQDLGAIPPLGPPPEA